MRLLTITDEFFEVSQLGNFISSKGCLYTPLPGRHSEAVTYRCYVVTDSFSCPATARWIPSRSSNNVIRDERESCSYIGQTPACGARRCARRRPHPSASPKPGQGHPQGQRDRSRYRGRPGIGTGGYPDAPPRLPGPRDPCRRERCQRTPERASIRSTAPPISRMAFRSSACRSPTSIADGSSLRWCSTRSSANCFGGFGRRACKLGRSLETLGARKA